MKSKHIYSYSEHTLNPQTDRLTDWRAALTQQQQHMRRIKPIIRAHETIKTGSAKLDHANQTIASTWRAAACLSVSISVSLQHPWIINLLKLSFFYKPPYRWWFAAFPHLWSQTHGIPAGNLDLKKKKNVLKKPQNKTKDLRMRMKSRACRIDLSRVGLIKMSVCVLYMSGLCVQCDGRQRNDTSLKS